MPARLTAADLCDALGSVGTGAIAGTPTEPRKETDEFNPACTTSPEPGAASIGLSFIAGEGVRQLFESGIENTDQTPLPQFGGETKLLISPPGDYVPAFTAVYHLNGDALLDLSVYAVMGDPPPDPDLVTEAFGEILTALDAAG